VTILESRKSNTGIVIGATIVVILVAIAIYVTLVYLPYFTSAQVSSATAVQTSKSSQSTGVQSGTVKVIIPQGTGTNETLNFAPSSITVVVGVNNTVTWVDNDTSAPHNVVSISVPQGATPFGSQNLNAGGTYTVTLTVPGTYRYECSIHPIWMFGVIVVKSG
jgi:plastocyanin